MRLDSERSTPAMMGGAAGHERKTVRVRLSASVGVRLRTDRRPPATHQERQQLHGRFCTGAVVPAGRGSSSSAARQTARRLAWFAGKSTSGLFSPSVVYAALDRLAPIKKGRANADVGASHRSFCKRIPTGDANNTASACRNRPGTKPGFSGRVRYSRRGCRAYPVIALQGDIP